MLHRISSGTNDLINQEDEFTFLSLKQRQFETKQTSSIYYLMSISKNGYPTLKKVKTSMYQAIDLNHAGSYNQLWSLSNQKINMNEFKNGFGFRLSLKLNEKFIEIKVNGTYLSRFELVDSSKMLGKPANRQEKFEIESIKFANFESLSHIQNYKNNFNSFLLYDLALNNNLVLFRNDPLAKNALKISLLDKSLNYFTTINNLSTSNVIPFKASLDDFHVIEEMNKNDVYCISKESVYLIANSNVSFVLPSSSLNAKK